MYVPPLNVFHFPSHFSFEQWYDCKGMMIIAQVPPMGLFYPTLLTPDVYPPPPRTWLVDSWISFCAVSMFVNKLYVYTILVVSLARFHDYEDMLEDTWHIDFSRRSDMPDTFYPNVNGGLPMWESYPVFSTKPKKEEKVGLAEAITNCILSTGNYVLFFSFYTHKFEALFNCLVLYSQVA